MDKKRRFIINTVWWLLAAGIVWLAMRYAVPILMPFIIGFLTAALINPPVRALSKRFDLKRRPIGILILLIFYATIGMLATVLIVRVAVMLGELSKALPTIYSESIEPSLGKLFELINRAVEKLGRVFGKHGGVFSDDLEGFFGTVKSSLGSAVSDISVKVLTKLSGFAAGIPGVVVQIVFAVISSFFFTVDFERILAALKRLLPEKTVALLTSVRDCSFRTLGRYIRSYALIMLITFAELSVGLLILRIGKAFALAFGIALFDILPVLGTGGVLLPWALMKLVGGDIGKAVGLTVIWGIVSIVRNIIEPKIIGGQVGLHPLVTLIAMYVGTKLFGVTGLFALPIGLAVAYPVWKERRDNIEPSERDKTP